MSFLSPSFKEKISFQSIFSNPYLIQIVKKPIDLNTCSNRNDWLLKSFKFGGKTEEFGGFNTSQIDRIASIMSFKGMGSSQYEWGAVPCSFEYFTKNSFTNFNFDLKNYPVTIYVICNTQHIKQIKKFINKLSVCSDWSDLRKNKFNLRDLTYFKQSIENFIETGDTEYAGWLQLDNPFFFFLDKKMYQNLLNLFMPNSKHFIMSD